MSDLTVLGLRVLVEVADRGSFTAAADALGYTQSAVSRQVQSTEAAAGAALFARGARGVVPTDAGRLLVRHARQILAGVEAAEADLATRQDRLVGRLRVGAFPTAAAQVVPRAIASLLPAHPGLEIDLREAGSVSLVAQLRAGRIGVAVVAAGDDLPAHELDGLEVDTVHVARGLGVAVHVEHRLAGRGPVPASELSGETWVVGSGRGPQFGAWPTLVDPVVGFRAGGWPTRLGLVAAGLGVAVVPAVAAEMVPRGVLWLPVVDPDLAGARQTLLLTRSGPSPAARAFVEAVRAEVTALSRRLTS